MRGGRWRGGVEWFGLIVIGDDAPFGTKCI